MFSNSFGLKFGLQVKTDIHKRAFISFRFIMVSRNKGHALIRNEGADIIYTGY